MSVWTSGCYECSGAVIPMLRSEWDEIIREAFPGYGICKIGNNSPGGHSGGGGDCGGGG